ncbi:MAG: prepilin peptidase [Paracoccaceae bacterium]
MAITAWSALWYLPFVVPICIWVAWSDMKFMKIPNYAVYSLAAIFVVVGIVALPLVEIPFRLLQLVLVLVIGFALNMIGAIGAGDAKFAAVMAPFLALGDTRLMLYLFAGVLLSAVVTHKIFKRIPAMRDLTPEWESWSTKKFPMGLALGPTLGFYLVAGAIYGA